MVYNFYFGLKGRKDWVGKCTQLALRAKLKT